MAQSAGRKVRKGYQTVDYQAVRRSRKSSCPESRRRSPTAEFYLQAIYSGVTTVGQAPRMHPLWRINERKEPAAASGVTGLWLRSR